MGASESRANLPDEALSFEQALAELEKIVRDMEEGKCGLEAALEQYETGVRLLKRCFEELRRAEQRIVQLKGIDAAGQPIVETFGHAATAERSELLFE